MSEWLPAVTTTSLLAVAMWLARNLIATRLAKSVEFEFNDKLERVRTELRESEERFKAGLRAREAEIAALRGGALSALASRQAALHARQIEAVEQIWAAVQALSPTKSIAITMAVLNLDKAADLAKRDSNERAMLEDMGGKLDITKLDVTSASKARPFLPQNVWATYLALSAIAFHSAITWQMIKDGIADREKYMGGEALNKLIAAALPEYSESIAKHGSRVYHLLIDKLEDKLLRELQNVLAGVEADKESVERAGTILKLASEVLKEEKTATATSSAIS